MSETNSKLIDEISAVFSNRGLEVEELEKIGVIEECSPLGMYQPPYHEFQICTSFDVYSAVLNGEKIEITCMENTSRGCSFTPKN